MSEAPLKFTITHYRNQHHTHEAFIKWIVEGHLPLAIPILKKHGMLTYSLFVTPAPANEALKKEFQEYRPTWAFADYDCIIEYTFRDMEVVRNVMSDPDWVGGALKGQEEWVDVPKALVSIGYCTPYLLATGDVVNMSK